jgi:hypothetical protein
MRALLVRTPEFPGALKLEQQRKPRDLVAGGFRLVHEVLAVLRRIGAALVRPESRVVRVECGVPRLIDLARQPDVGARGGTH